jgi:hypothetical protein
MEPIAIVIFYGIPLTASVVGLVAVASILLHWRSARSPEMHYIASRIRAAPVAETDRRWLAELDALCLPYRHTIC